MQTNVHYFFLSKTYTVNKYHVRIRTKALRVIVQQVFEATAEAFSDKDEGVLKVQIFVVVVPFFFVISTISLFRHVEKSARENIKKGILSKCL